MRATMKTVAATINTYLLVVGLVVVIGCQSAEERKRSRELSTIRLHLEVNPDTTGRSAPVPVFREAPLLVNIEKESFLDEGNLERAWVEDAIGGFVIKLQFNSTGKLMLDGVTAGNKGRRIAVASQFPELRWVAAPRITGRLAEGVIGFTPDATREEADRIVRGLNNVIAKVKKRSFIE